MQKSYSFAKEPGRSDESSKALLKQVFEILADVMARAEVPEESLRKLCEEAPPPVGYPPSPRKLPWLGILQEYQVLAVLLVLTNGAGTWLILLGLFGGNSPLWIFVAIGTAGCAYASYRLLRSAWRKFLKIRAARSGFQTWAVVWNIDHRVETSHDSRGRERKTTTYHAQFVYLTEDDDAAVGETVTSGDHPRIVDEEFETVLITPDKRRLPFLADDLFPGTRWVGDGLRATLVPSELIIFTLTVLITGAILGYLYYRLLT